MFINVKYNFRLFSSNSWNNRKGFLNWNNVSAWSCILGDCICFNIFYLNLRLATSRSQASCGMRLLRNQLCCPLPSLFLLPLMFYLVCCLSLLSRSLQQRFTTRPNGFRESCSGANWSVSARLKPADDVACSLEHKANQLVATSPVAKKLIVQQPIGTHALWNYRPESPIMVWVQSQGVEQKSGVLSVHLNNKMLKYYYGMLVQWHHKQTAYLNFNVEQHQSNKQERMDESYK